MGWKQAAPPSPRDQRQDRTTRGGEVSRTGHGGDGTERRGQGFWVPQKGQQEQRAFKNEERTCRVGPAELTLGQCYRSDTPLFSGSGWAEPKPRPGGCSGRTPPLGRALRLLARKASDCGVRSSLGLVSSVQRTQTARGKVCAQATWC